MKRAARRAVPSAQFSDPARPPSPQAVSWFAVGATTSSSPALRTRGATSPSCSSTFAPGRLPRHSSRRRTNQTERCGMPRRLSSRPHVPWLGIRMEYRTNHIDLALQYIKRLSSSPRRAAGAPRARRALLPQGRVQQRGALLPPGRRGLAPPRRRARSRSSTSATRTASCATSTPRQGCRVALPINPRLASTLGVDLRSTSAATSAAIGSTTELPRPDDTFTCEMLTEALKDLDEAVDPTRLGFGPPTGSIAGGAGSSGAAVVWRSSRLNTVLADGRSQGGFTWSSSS